jgi:hypothetical protein
VNQIILQNINHGKLASYHELSSISIQFTDYYNFCLFIQLYQMNIELELWIFKSIKIEIKLVFQVKVYYEYIDSSNARVSKYTFECIVCSRDR